MIAPQPACAPWTAANAGGLQSSGSRVCYRPDLLFPSGQVVMAFQVFCNFTNTTNLEVSLILICFLSCLLCLTIVLLVSLEGTHCVRREVH